jgi:hypothetical protein
MFSASRGQDFRRDRYEPLVTVAHAPSSLPISIPMHVVSHTIVFSSGFVMCREMSAVISLCVLTQYYPPCCNIKRY